MDDYFSQPDPSPTDEVDQPERTVVFEDLTLGQALAYLFWRPVQAGRLFWQVLTRDPAQAGPHTPPSSTDGLTDDTLSEDEMGAPPSFFRELVPAAMGEDEPPFPVTAPLMTATAPGRIAKWQARGGQAWARIGVLIAAVALALHGGYVLHGAALDPALHARFDTNGAAVWFELAGALIVGSEVFASRRWWVRRLPSVAAWLRRRLVGRGGPSYGNAILVALLLLAGWLGLIGPGGPVVSAALLALTGALWLALVMGNTLPDAARGLGAESDLIEADENAEVVYVVRSAWAEGEVGPVPAEEMPAPTVPARSGLAAWFEAHVYHLLLIPPALVLSAAGYALNVAHNDRGQVSDVVFTTPGFFAWVLSILLWLVVLGTDPRTLPGRLRAFDWRALAGRIPRLRLTWTLVALIAIMGVGAVFRLYDLSAVPPEMTSDHIEKLLDALRVSEGYRGVFFPNNGGREAFQMYVVALIANLGVGFSFTALKLATAIEGLITLPALWWMARQVIGTDTEYERQLGNWIGLALAALVAVSSWHVMLSRLGLRIVLTPLTAAVVMGLLARAMRYNRTGDYLALGVTLGAGTYFYQANRMLPLVVVAGIGLAVLSYARSGRVALRLVGDGVGLAILAATPLAAYGYLARALQQSGYNHPQEIGDRLASFTPMFVMAWFGLLALSARRQTERPVLTYGGGLLMVAVVALAIYIPLYHYSELFPDTFWNRTRGRMFGEEAFVRIDPVSNLPVQYEPTLREQAERFWDQRAVFGQNYRDALRLAHWEGDGMWISNARARPALGAVAGGLLILGLVMWGVGVFKRPNAATWLIPVTIGIMLLPSALTLAYTNENPSFTRASGTIPAAFMLAALPLGTLGWRLASAPWGRRLAAAGLVMGLLLPGWAVWRAAGPDWDNYFTAYRLSYSYSWKPYREIAKPLRAFAQGEGSYGNAFMVAYPHWLDHRILGTMAGDIRWSNGLVKREEVFAMIAQNQGTPYEYDPTRPLFFMYHVQDEDTARYLQNTFPGGTTMFYEYRYETDHGTLTGQFYIYTVQFGPLTRP